MNTTDELQASIEKEHRLDLEAVDLLEGELATQFAEAESLASQLEQEATHTEGEIGDMLQDAAQNIDILSK